MGGVNVGRVLLAGPVAVICVVVGRLETECMIARVSSVYETLVCIHCHITIRCHGHDVCLGMCPMKVASRILRY